MDMGNKKKKQKQQVGHVFTSYEIYLSTKNINLNEFDLPFIEKKISLIFSLKTHINLNINLFTISQYILLWTKFVVFFFVYLSVIYSQYSNCIQSLRRQTLII